MSDNLYFVPEGMTGEEYYTQETERNGLELSSRAILVRIKECMNGVYKYDSTARKDLADSAGAALDAYSVTKRLYPKYALKELEQCISQARHVHRMMTLPWNDVGYRLLPNTRFFDFVTAINAIKERFTIARDYFKENLALYKQEGMIRMGNYAEDAYPKVEDIDKLFQLEVIIRPCPNSGDIRVDVPEDVLQELRHNSDLALKSDVTEAVKDLWMRFHKNLKHMKTQLDSADPKHYRSTMLNNISEIIDIIPEYNLTDDSELEKTRQEAKEIIKDIKSIDDVKDNETLRRETVDKLDSLLNKFPEM